MSISLSHPLWVWFLAAVMFCLMLIHLFHVTVPDVVIGVLAGLTFVFCFVSIPSSTPPA